MVGDMGTPQNRKKKLGCVLVVDAAHGQERRVEHRRKPNRSAPEPLKRSFKLIEKLLATDTEQTLLEPLLNLDSAIRLLRADQRGPGVLVVNGAIGKLRNDV